MWVQCQVPAQALWGPGLVPDSPAARSQGMQGLKACFVAPSPTTSTTSDKSQCRPIRRSRRPRLREGHQCGRCSHPGAMRQSLGSHADTSTGRGWDGLGMAWGCHRWRRDPAGMLGGWDGLGWDVGWDGDRLPTRTHSHAHAHTHTPHHTRCDVLTYLVDAPSLRLHGAPAGSGSGSGSGCPVGNRNANVNRR